MTLLLCREGHLQKTLTNVHCNSKIVFKMTIYEHLLLIIL